MSTSVEPVTTPEQSALVPVREYESTASISPFSSDSAFASAQRIARALASSEIVPAPYRGEKGVANSLIALELANRTGASVMMVMQNMHVIQGKPSWSATFLIGSVNSCGRFTPIRYEVEGEIGKDGCRCRAYATDKATGDRLDGEWITWEMVKAEGWLGKPNSKWKTMPGQMIRYRAASFWTRTYAPEISLGMHTADEVDDVVATPVVSTKDLNAALKGEPSAEVRPSVNVLDVPCEACGVAPWKEHKSECPHA